MTYESFVHTNFKGPIIEYKYLLNSTDGTAMSAVTNPGPAAMQAIKTRKEYENPNAHPL